MAGFRNRSVSTNRFAMVPRADVPRSSFRMEKAYKTTFDADYLIPIFCEEVLPGDSIRGKFTAYVRTETMLYPIMDNLHMETFFFFVPNRLVWSNWKKFMGERENTPEDSIDYSVPILASGSPFEVGTIYDYFGLPTNPNGAQNISSLPLRMYNFIWNEWFRDQNLQDAVPVSRADADDSPTYYNLLKRGKRHDYFTSALPWTQKGDPVALPLGQTAPVGTSSITFLSGVQQPLKFSHTDGTTPSGNFALGSASGFTGVGSNTYTPVAGQDVYPNNLFADLSQATATTINQIRQAFQIQRLLERDARGGTRYTELVRSHFGVISPDARLQRPEYIGGGYQSVSVHQVAQTADLTDGPLGQLGAFGTSAGQHRFSVNATEHGYIIGLANVRADLTYQQGIRKHWTRRTRYDFYFPVFAGLGEQAIKNKEIYATGGASDDEVFGYQERWNEYRVLPSEITGQFRSTATGTLDAWHLSQQFLDLPTLSSDFIEPATPMGRVLATGTTAPAFIMDGLFNIKAARPLPMFGIPGLVDHF